MLGFLLEGKETLKVGEKAPGDEHGGSPSVPTGTGQLGFNSFAWINSRSRAPHPIIPREKYLLTKVWRGEIFATCWARGFSEDI